MNETKRLNDPVVEWLGAYLDGELTPERAAWVEAHLESCPDCRSDLESLRSLSSLLHAGDETLDASLTLGLAPAAASAVLSGVPPRKASSRLVSAFRYLPLALFGGWAFIQSLLLVTGVLAFAGVFFPGLPSSLGWLFSEPAEPLSLVSILCNLLPGNAICDLLDSFRQLPFIGGLSFWSLLITAISALLFVSWLAGLWVHRRATTQTV